MTKNTPPKDILQELIKRRVANVLLLSKCSDEDLKDLAKRYREALEIAEENNNFVYYKIRDEKLSQIYEAVQLKFSLTDEASEWIHW